MWEWVGGRTTWKAAVHGVAKSRTRLSDFTFTFHFHALEKEMATHSSILSWRIPGMGEPGGLPSMGSHTVGHNCSYLAAAAAAACISGLHSRLPRGVRPRLEGKPRTQHSSRVATRVSWSPLSGLKAVQVRCTILDAWGWCTASTGSLASQRKNNPECWGHRSSAAAAANSLQSCLTLWDPIDGSPPGSPIPGILQERILEWVAISFSRLSFPPRD